MPSGFPQPTFWLEFKVLSDGLRASEVAKLPLTEWHQKNNTVFRLFPELPAELRLKVWEYLIAPRVVGIACLCLEEGGPSVELQRHEIWGSQPVIAPPVPVLLHVNRETRDLALKHYELSFEWKVPRVLAGAGQPPPAPAPASVQLPVITTPAFPPIAPQTSHLSPPTPNPAVTSLPHISSYHDLLNPSPSTNHSSRTAGSGTGASRPTGPNNAGSTAHSATGLAPAPERRTSSPPRTWFNFDLDVVYLLGELEPCDSFGFNSPMTYFIPSQTARRVRKTAVSFRALRYGETGGQQIFGALFHVVDRFTPVDGEVLVCVAEVDEWTHDMMGSDTPLLGDGYRAEMARRSSGAPAPIPRNEDNAVQRIWRDWYRGSIVTSPLAGLRFSLVAREHLEEHVYDSMVATPTRQKKKGDVRAGKTGVDR
ncbi:hypothetical protein F4861DRAFT_495541 [Xylaria intraflava]|nr:hypothetical protein F4861DRAFT_495541 [Xylaria intraflava]